MRSHERGKWTERSSICRASACASWLSRSMEMQSGRRWKRREASGRENLSPKRERGISTSDAGHLLLLRNPGIHPELANCGGFLAYASGYERADGGIPRLRFGL